MNGLKIQILLFGLIVFLGCNKKEEVVPFDCSDIFLFQSTAICPMHTEGGVAMINLANEEYVASNFRDFADPSDYDFGDTIRINFDSPDSSVYKLGQEGLLCGPTIIGVEVRVVDFCE